MSVIILRYWMQQRSQIRPNFDCVFPVALFFARLCIERYMYVVFYCCLLLLLTCTYYICNIYNICYV